jgi:hypothetical protein
MAKTKPEGTDKASDEELPKWDGTAHGEKYCAICQGMVNGNGCAAEVCPVRPN